MTLKLISIQIPAAWQVWLQSAFSAAVGGAYGAVSDVFIQGWDKGGVHLNQIDYHRLAAVAAGGAAMALAKRWMKPPNSLQAETITPATPTTEVKGGG